MTKLCPRGKAAAKRKFKVYPSAYTNAYASKICAGKIKDPSGTKRKDFKGPKPAKKGAMIKANEGKDIRQTPSQKISEALKRPVGPNEKIGDITKELKRKNVKVDGTLQKGTVKPGKVAPGKFDLGTLGKPVDTSKFLERRANLSNKAALAKKLKDAYDKVPSPVKRKVGLGVLGTTGVVGAGVAGAVSLYELGKAGVESGKRVHTAYKAGKYRDEKKPTATFQKRSKKKEQIRDQKSEKFLAGKGFNYGGQVGGHEVMGSPISVDVDDDNLSNSSAMAYYKDLT